MSLCVGYNVTHTGRVCQMVWFCVSHLLAPCTRSAFHICRSFFSKKKTKTKTLFLSNKRQDPPPLAYALLRPSGTNIITRTLIDVFATAYFCVSLLFSLKPCRNIGALSKVQDIISQFSGCRIRDTNVEYFSKL